ncbi:MAG: hypothetical protein WB930_13830 [Syntrophobacteraceae bacterium]
MDYITEKGTLPFGILQDGVRHRDFEIRPRLVKDTLEVAREQGMESLKDDIFFSLCLTAKQILYIGDIAPVSVDVLLEMLDKDMGTIITVKDTLASRLESFRDDAEIAGEKGEPDIAARTDTPGEKAGPGASEDTVSGGDGS